MKDRRLQVLTKDPRVAEAVRRHRDVYRRNQAEIERLQQEVKDSSLNTCAEIVALCGFGPDHVGRTMVDADYLDQLGFVVLNIADERPEDDASPPEAPNPIPVKSKLH